MPYGNPLSFGFMLLPSLPKAQTLRSWKPCTLIRITCYLL